MSSYKGKQCSLEAAMSSQRKTLVQLTVLYFLIEKKKNVVDALYVKLLTGFPPDSLIR